MVERSWLVGGQRDAPVWLSSGRLLTNTRDGWPLYISSPLSPAERRYRSGEKSRASVPDVSFHHAHLPVRTSVYAGRHCGRQAVRPGRQTESSQTRVQGISAATPSGID